jgi:hypothetical protein
MDDPELVELVKSWVTLPAEVRHAIILMAKAGKGGRP